MAPTPTLKLTYFPFAGPAEPVRMALAMTGQPWEDNRIPFAEFPTMKPGKLELYVPDNPPCAPTSR